MEASKEFCRNLLFFVYLEYFKALSFKNFVATFYFVFTLGILALSFCTDYVKHVKIQAIEKTKEWPCPVFHHV
jgi:hypothetical protein